MDETLFAGVVPAPRVPGAGALVSDGLRVLALDLGTRCGWAWLEPEAPLRWGSWDLARAGAFDGYGARLFNLYHQLGRLRPELIVYEDVRRHLGVEAAHFYGALVGTLLLWCAHQQEPVAYASVGVGAVKKHATGKGNAKKPAMIEAARRRWGEVDDADQADALWLLATYLEVPR